jgi:transmembrane sensor
VLDDDSESLDTLEPEEIEVQLSWREGNLIFDGESLHQAVSEISRYTTVEFVFVDEDLQRIRVAGLFKAGDLTGFLASLRANFDIAYEQVNDNTILLSALGGDAN